MKIVKKKKRKLLIVDDIEMNRAILAESFHNQNDKYEIIEAENGQDAWNLIQIYADSIVAVLLDLIMPVMDGFEVLEKMTEYGYMKRIPVILITTETLGETVERAFDMGVVDIIAKPFNPSFIQRRLDNTIELYRHREELQDIVDEQTKILKEQAKELKETNTAIIETLSTAIEFRDCESGEHVKRIRTLTEMILYELRHEGYPLTENQIQAISDAAIMHDVGKIAIPDKILNKPGKLTSEEFEIMKQHTIWGCELLNSVERLRKSEIYQYAYDICRHHHERYDGNGYPDGLKGDEISIWAQVVSIADVYDALVNERVYKAAYTHQEAMSMINNGECGIFNPSLLKKFNEIIDGMRKLYHA